MNSYSHLETSLETTMENSSLELRKKNAEGSIWKSIKVPFKKLGAIIKLSSAAPDEYATYPPCGMTHDGVYC